jgi:carboxyl-terminal processing protease
MLTLIKLTIRATRRRGKGFSISPSPCHPVAPSQKIAPSPRRPVTLSLLLSLSLLLLGWIAVSAQVASPQLTREERLKVFERVWQGVNDNYYDKTFHGVDWLALRAVYRPLAESARDNAEFYGVLQRMIGELRDAHTRVFAPEEGFDRYRPAGLTVGLMVRRVEDQVVVVWVEPGSEAARQGIRPGLVVASVNGAPVEEALARAKEEVGGSSSLTAHDLQGFSRLFYGPRGAAVEVTFMDEEGRTRRLRLVRRFAEFPRRVIARRLPGDLGYLELTGFGPEMERDFEQAMTLLGDARGVILDLRNNGGGFVRSVVRVASYFFAEETDLGQFIARNGRVARHYTKRLRAVYQQPLVVLTSARSASGAEMLAATLQERKRAFVIGYGPTCGCLLGVSRTLRLPDSGKLNVSDTDYRTSRGRRIEGTGIEPDQRVELRIADLLAGRDRALELAVEHLAKSPGSGVRSPESETRIKNRGSKVQTPRNQFRTPSLRPETPDSGLRTPDSLLPTFRLSR